MSNKLSDLDNSTRKNIEDELMSKSQQMGMDAFESYGIEEKNILKDQIGICYNCNNLNYCKTEFGNVLAICSSFNIKLSGQNRISECNLHSQKDMLSLNDMYAIAYLIDPSEEKVDGFISTKEKYKKK